MKAPEFINGAPNVVIVGGGAGGLALATQLGNRFGKRKQANIILVDPNLTHIWKPLLHEVAAGTLDSNEDEVSYILHGVLHHYHFRMGRMDSIDREKKFVSLAPTVENGEEIIPRREIPYDILVVAVGSHANDFNTEGAQKNCYFLDNRAEADSFHHELVNQFFRAHTHDDNSLNIAIVGAGATGVELAAELHTATIQANAYGMSHLDPNKVNISIIEAAPRVLPQLTDRISNMAVKELKELRINTFVNERVTKIDEGAVYTASGRVVPAHLKVWAAGIMAPRFLKGIAGLDTNKNNQLIVRPTLQTTKDDDIFAMGDCSDCTTEDGVRVPPRAMAASQEASMLYHTIAAKLNNKSLPKFHYHDYGSLVSFSEDTAVGNLMGNIGLKANMFIEGFVARQIYLSLYKKHQVALHGWLSTGLSTVGGFFRRGLRPRIKLH